MKISLLIIIFFAGILGFIFLYTSPKSVMERKSLIVISLLSILFFLEEVSFGKQWIHYSAPVLYGKKIDGFHDFFEILYKFIQNNLLLGNILSLVFVVLAWYLIKNINIKIKKNILKPIKEQKSFTFVGTSLLLLLMAQTIDIGLFPINGFFEEVMELCASIGLFFAVFSFHEKTVISEEISTSVRLKKHA